MKGKGKESRKRKTAQRVITVLLSFIMVFTMMPWLAPDKGQADAAIGTLLWPARNNNGDAVTSINWGFEGNGKNQHRGIDINGASKWYAAYGGTIDTIYSGCKASRAVKENPYHKGCSPVKNGKPGSRYPMTVLVDGRLWYGEHCNNGFGNGVIIKCNIGGTTYYMQYAHMGSVSSSLKVGQAVSKGTYLGTVGGTGCATGVHAHFEVCRGSAFGTAINTNKNGQFAYDYARPDKIVAEKPSVQEDRSRPEWSIGTNNAVPCAKVYNPNVAQISTVGIKVKEGNNVIANKSETVPSNHSRLQTMWAWFDINKECKVTLKPGTTYTYEIYAYVGGQQYSTGWRSFTTKGNPTPDNLTFSTPKKDYAAGDSVIVSWGADSKASKGYSVTIKQVKGGNHTETKSITSYKSNQAAFVLPSVGEYQISGYALGSAKNSAVTTMNKTIVAHGPSVVKFIETDDNGENENLLSQQTIKYGYPATAPANVTRKGHTFTGWDKSFSNVTSDLTVTAQFKRNKYKITFYDKDDNVISTSTVEYEGSIDPPEAPEPETGYVFLGWDSDAYKNVQGNASIHASYAWANDELPVVVTVNSCEFKDDGYVINYNVKNNPDKNVKGRALVSLHTAGNKLLATTESSAFSLAKSQEKKNQEIFIPYEGAASKASIYIVNEFGSGIPISDCVTSNVVRNWSDWTTEKPSADDISESRTEYRKKDKILTTTRTATNDGWTQYDKVLDSNWTFGSWSGYSKTKYTASESTTAKREVQTRKVVDKAAYTNYHWYYYRYWNSSAGKYYYTYSANMGGTKYTWTTTYMLPQIGTYDGRAGYKPKGGKNFSDEIWWLESKNNVAETSHTEYRYRDGTKGYTYYWYKWGDWSDWTPDTLTANSSREVETRTTYRVMDAMGEEDTSGDTYTVSGSVDAALAGKQALIQVYKNDEPSDSNNEYVGQTVIGDGGEYSFTFTTREKISRKTGDFTVVLGIEGSSKQIFVKTIEAPKPVYTVTFKDADGNVISSQQVDEGKSATSPEVPNREHYTFVGWDYGITNIRDDMDVTAQYVPEKYAVAFVNWDTQEASAEVFSYGDPIDYPDATEIEGYEFTGWTTPDGKTVDSVTGNMVLQANYKILSYKVRFLDETGKLLDEQDVIYGQAAEAPKAPERSKMVFKDWSTYEYNEVHGNLDVAAIYEYVDSTGTPTCDTPSGTFKKATDIHLTADDDAKIYYTVDGTVPTVDSNEYKDKITVDKNMYLQYIAIAPDKNPSKIQSASYLVSSGEDDEGALVVKSEEYELEKGEETTITYSLWGSEADVRFFSLDEEIATVDDGGIVHANKAGTTKILVRTIDNKYADYCDIIVTNSATEVESIDLQTVLVSGVPGETVKLNPNIEPDNATNNELDWFIDDDSIATVSNEGELKFLAKGRTTLSVYSKDGGASTAVVVEGVSSQPQVSNGVFPSNDMLGSIGETTSFAVFIDGNESTATWSSSDEKVATIAADGTATAKGYGKSVITAVTEDGTEYEATLTVERVISSKSVKDAIAALPDEVTQDDKNTVSQIREDYDGLSTEEKAEITEDELAKLEAAEAAIEASSPADPAEELEQAKADKEKAEAEKEQAVADKEKAEAEKEQAVADKEKAEAEARAAEQKAAAAEQKAAEAEQSAAAAQQEAAAAQQKAATAQQEAATAQANLAAAQQELADLQASNEATEEELEQAKTKLDEAKQAEASAKQAAAEAEKAAATAEAAAAEAEHKLADAENELKDANTALAKANEEKNAALQAASEAGQRATDAEANAETARQAAAEAEQRATEAEQRATDAEARATDAEARAETAEAALKEIEGGEDILAAEQRAAEAEAAAAEAEKRATEAEKRASDAEARASDAETRVSAAEARAEAAEKALAEAQNSKTDISEMRLMLTDEEEWYRGQEICPYDNSIMPYGDLDSLKVNKDYTVSYKNNRNVGTATAVIKGKGKYTGTLKTTFKIVPCDLSYDLQDSEITALKATRFVYNGSAKNVALKSSEYLPKPFKQGVDYVITYPDGNKTVGVHTAVLTCKGNYKGKVSFKFTILPKATVLRKLTPAKKKITVKWKKQSAQTTGYQVQYGRKKNFKGAKTITVKKSKTVKTTIKKLKSKKTYYVRIRTYKTVGKAKFYSTWSKAKRVKVK